MVPNTADTGTGTVPNSKEQNRTFPVHQQSRFRRCSSTTGMFTLVQYTVPGIQYLEYQRAWKHCKPHPTNWAEMLAIETHRNKSIGTMMRCSSAFGADQIVVVGSPAYATHGAIGAQNYVGVVHFYYWQECIDYCRNAGCSIYSISPVELNGNEAEDEFKSVSVDKFEFSGPACFIVGEKSGLTSEQCGIADAILHVEVPNKRHENKIMYDAKVAICLQVYAEAIKLAPRSHLNEKHLLGEIDHHKPKTLKVGKLNARKHRGGVSEGETAGSNEGVEGVAGLFG
jgi:hypothetical protein